MESKRPIYPNSIFQFEIIGIVRWQAINEPQNKVLIILSSSSGFSGVPPDSLMCSPILKYMKAKVAARAAKGKLSKYFLMQSLFENV